MKKDFSFHKITSFHSGENYPKHENSISFHKITSFHSGENYPKHENSV